MSETRQSQPVKMPERIGRYTVVRPLSKGGMAMVWEARRDSLAGVSPRVAIKLILPEHQSSDQFQELFINEARLGANLHHQNLVQIQDFNRDGDSFYLVMEYVDGLTLRRLISLSRKHKLPIPLSVIAEVGRQVCEGLYYAHTAVDERGRPLHLVHRDMKPSNLILNPHGVVKVLDFGISKGSLMKERKGAVKGTWGYMAPEQATGREVGPQADVFGLAVVLYEMAALGPLFKVRKQGEIKRLLQDDHAARMAATLDPEQYGPLVKVLVRALQRDPAARYATAREFGRALGSLLQDPVSARDALVHYQEVCQALHEGREPPAGLPDTPLAEPAQDNSQASVGSMVGDEFVPSATSKRGGGAGVAWAVVGLLMFTLLGLAVVAVAVVMLRTPDPAALDEPSVPDVGDVLNAVEPSTPQRSEPEPELAAEEPAGPAGEGAPGEERPRPVASQTRESRPPPASSLGAAPAERPRRVTPVEEPAEPAEEEPVTVVVVRSPQPAEPVVTEAPAEPDPEPEVPAPVSDEPARVTLSATVPGAEVYIDGKFIRTIPVVRKEFPPGEHFVSIAAPDGRTKRFRITLEPGEEIRKVWDFDRGEWRR